MMTKTLFRIILATAMLIFMSTIMVAMASATTYRVDGYCFPAGSTIYLDNGVYGATVSGADGHFTIESTSITSDNGHALRFTCSGYYEQTVSFNFGSVDHYYNAGSRTLSIIPTPTPTPPPVAGFSGTPVSGISPLTVTFTSSSSGVISSYDYNWGDGTSHGTSASMSHQYTTPGTYTVNLTVTGPGGSNTQTRNNYITVNYPAPTASFVANVTSGMVPLTVGFDNSASTGTITSYAWSWGDATANGTTTNPSHQYATPGTYTVILTVTGPGGSSSQQQTDYINVVPEPPLITTCTATPTSGYAPLTVQFNSTTIGTVSSRTWDFDDGTTSTSANVTYTYTYPGTYHVTLTVSNTGGYDIENLQVVVSPNWDPTPTPTPVPTPTPGPAGYGTVTPHPGYNRLSPITNRTLNAPDTTLYNKTLYDFTGGGNPGKVSWNNFLGDVIIPILLTYGPLFWGLLCGVIILLIYNRQESGVIPVFLVLAGGIPIILWTLPYDWQKAAGALITLVIAGVLYALRKKRY